MSTQSPKGRNISCCERTSDSGIKTNMAVAKTVSKTVKVKRSSKSKSKSKDGDEASNLHRRSRTGCYTCRLRRKKCDEGAPLCTACNHLGLQCHYNRPPWWSDNDARRNEKEDIKMIIKKKRLSEKSTNTIQTTLSSPPSLSHSLPTSAGGTEPLDRDRSASIDSRASGMFNFNSPPSVAEYMTYSSQVPPEFMAHGYSPYEIDVKTERQMYVDDVPTLRESHVSTFSTYQTPPPPGTVLPPGHEFPGGWTEHYQEERRQSLAEEALNVNFFDFAHGPAQDSAQVAIELTDSDQNLLNHFMSDVLTISFPILECNQHGSVVSEFILPALQSNHIYLHCCLSIAAQHLKTHGTGTVNKEELNQDVMRHRYATIWSLCDALNADENHQQILEATLGLIFFQCVVGRPDDGLLDIAWHQHFGAAVSLVQKLNLPATVSDASAPMTRPVFNMTMAAWIDILGATIQGVSPTFAHTYREKHLSQHPQLGLRELMGCEDRVMYLISEIACLESLKAQGMDDFVLCQHISSLGEQINLTENSDSAPRSPYNEAGAISPKQLTRNITVAFRLAARIYLCSLVPGFNPNQESVMTLVDKLTGVLEYIPAGAEGFDRSLVWVYLIAGSVSTANSEFRSVLAERTAQLGESARCGSFGRMVTVLQEVWLQNDVYVAPSPGSSPSDTPVPYVHWREVMAVNNWDYLLI